jgi:hypothetical protein
VGRANDVTGLIVDNVNVAPLKARNSSCFLLDIKRVPNHAERGYIQFGEASGILKRYILANRRHLEASWRSSSRRDELDELALERNGKLFQRANGEISFATLNGAHIGPVQAGAIREFLLRQPDCSPALS